MPSDDKRGITIWDDVMIMFESLAMQRVDTARCVVRISHEEQI